MLIRGHIVPASLWRRARAAGLAAALLGTVACATSGGSQVSVSGAWVRAAALARDGASVSSAAYLTIQHSGDIDDMLVGVQSPVADAAEVHRTAMEDGVARMRPAGDVPVAAHSTLTLEPGGQHIMLIGLHQNLKEGTSVPLTLEFRRAGRVSIQAPVHAEAPASASASASAPSAGATLGGR